MTHAVIDISSNTIRTNVYAITGMAFQPLLAKNHCRTRQLHSRRTVKPGGAFIAFAPHWNIFKMLHRIGVSSIGVFATASIRNVNNTKEILQAVKKQTGYTIDILNGEDEALLDYYGMLHNIDASRCII